MKQRYLQGNFWKEGNGIQKCPKEPYIKYDCKWEWGRGGVKKVKSVRSYSVNVAGRGKGGKKRLRNCGHN